MKTKTIKKVLHGKIKAWADSVTDNPAVAKLIMEKTIVTGGCIPSMLTGKDVNDYDIYLTDKYAVKTIAEYYAKKASALGYDIVVIDGKDYPNFNYNKVSHDPMFASEEGDTRHNDADWMLDNGTKIDSHQLGRCVHMIEEDRIKLFMPNEGVIRIDKKHWLNEDKTHKQYFPIHLSSNAITLTDDIQVVIRFHGEPEKIHENYDFVHATNWYTAENNNLVLRLEALESLLTRELKYIGSKYPITSIIRTKKFILRGFSIGAGTYLKILYQVSLLDLNDLTVLEDQLAGVDVAYFAILMNALKEAHKKEGFELTCEYLFELIEKIFD